jgi:Glycosyltransferase family 87
MSCAAGRWRPGLLLAGGAVSAAAGTALSWRIASGARIRGEPDALLIAIAAWWVVFALGAACLLRAPKRGVLVVVIAGAVGMRVAALAGVPALSNDLERYAWDGRVQAAGIDPYRYPPDARQLAGLHEPWLWPDAATCGRLHRDAGCTRITRPGARTIYPPAAEAWFAGIHVATGGRTRDLGWQLAGFVVDLATLAVMLALLRAWRRDERFLVLYAWCPVAVIEAVQNGHIDGLAALVSLGVVWAAGRRPALAGALTGVAALVKLYPALLLALLVRPGISRALGAFAVVLAIGYLPHVLAVGPGVLGYLPSYLQAEDYAAGGRFLLLGAVGLSGAAAQGVAVAAIGTVAAGVGAALRRGTLTADAGARRLLGALLLIATPVQPWYALPLVAVAALDGAWWWLGVAAAGYPLFFHALEGVPLPALPSMDIGRAAYAAGLALALAGALVAARRPTGRSPA